MLKPFVRRALVGGGYRRELQHPLDEAVPPSEPLANRVRIHLLHDHVALPSWERLRRRRARQGREPDRAGPDRARSMLDHADGGRRALVSHQQPPPGLRACRAARRHDPPQKHQPRRIRRRLADRDRARHRGPRARDAATWRHPVPPGRTDRRRDLASRQAVEGSIRSRRRIRGARRTPVSRTRTRSRSWRKG